MNIGGDWLMAGWGRRRVTVVVMTCFLLVALGVTFAIADDSDPSATPTVPTSESVTQAIEEES
ncbi:MAG TPA: hypothetical protein VII45_00410, partial [Solirubrobacterales bacterium]